MKRLPPVLIAVLATAALAMSASQPADAAPNPCTASQIARTVGTVGFTTATYLDAHPDTNQALTGFAAQQPGPQTLAAVKAYFDAHPQTAADLGALQRPLASLSSQCQLPINLPAMLGLLPTSDAANSTVLR